MKVLSDLRKITKRELLALPHRAWQSSSTYDFLFLLPGNKTTDGWGHFTVIGVVRDGPCHLGEIASVASDDLCWSIPKAHPYGQPEGHYIPMPLRTDLIMPGRIIRMWASSEHYFAGRFHIGPALSSLGITLQIWPTRKNDVTGEMLPPPPKSPLWP